jgi:hypothetical protein
MLNQIEIEYIYHYDQFISFLFGNRNEKDPEQRIYNKLLQLEGNELEVWVNTKLKNYITYKGADSEFRDFEGVSGRRMFIGWYTLAINWTNREEGTNKLTYLQDIYYKSGKLLEKELNEINNKLKEASIPINHENYWQTGIFTNYMVMYIMNMSATELKSYIIQIMEPIEMK